MKHVCLYKAGEGSFKQSVFSEYLDFYPIRSIVNGPTNAVSHLVRKD